MEIECSSAYFFLFLVENLFYLAKKSIFAKIYSLKIMKKIKCLTLLLCLVICLTAEAEVYLIDSGATTAGAQITYRNQTFTVGTTAFASFDQLAAVSVP